MQRPQKLRVSTEEELHSAPCQDCGRDANHKTLAKVYAFWRDMSSGWDYTYRIIQCQGCLEITFSKAYTHSDVQDRNRETGDLYYPTEWEYYPDRTDGRNKIDGHLYLPPQVASIYDETLASLCASQFIMTGFGIRAIVEAVCNDRKVAGSNLQKKIDGLEKTGLIASADASILHNLRFMGNEAAHEQRVHGRNDLEAALDVVEHLLQGVYVIPQRAKELPKYDS